MRPTAVQIGVVGLTLLALVAVVLALAQPVHDPGRYEFPIRQSFEGLFRYEPVPALWVLRRHDSPEFSNYSMYPLVEPGRRGLSQATRRFDGLGVTLNGKLIYNGSLTVIEAEESSIARITRIVEFPDPLPPEELGEATLRGQILDLKSYAGFQEPGFGSWLISPASNAIRGGVPPVVIVRHRGGAERAVLLLNPNGASIGDAALGWCGAAVEVRGKLRSNGGMLMLETFKGSLRRLFPWE